MEFKGKNLVLLSQFPSSCRKLADISRHVKRQLLKEVKYSKICIFQLFTGFGGSLGFTMLEPPPRPIAFFCFSKCFFSFFSART